MQSKDQSLPPVEVIRNQFKAQFGRLKAKGIAYTAEDVHLCLAAYHERRLDVQESVSNILRSIESAISRDEPERISYAIHSTRHRLKDYMHVADKLLRKALDPSKPRMITPSTLFTNEGLMDLGGIRILHVRKSSWKIIHALLNDERHNWEVVKREGYIRDGQRPEYEEEGRFKGAELITHRRGVPNKYTSLHYMIRPSIYRGHSGVTVECQVRTIFEEGWAEIDHEINYPYEASPAFGRQLGVLNTATNTANEIASALESLEHLPKFVPWSLEQEMELQAEEVYCLSSKLNWFSGSEPERIYEQFQNGAEVMFRYYVLDDSAEIRAKASAILADFHSHGITNITFDFVPQEFKGKLPFLSDLLLLKGTYESAQNPEKDVVIMGTLIRNDTKKKRHKEEELDILVDDPESVKIVSRFFEELRAHFESSKPEELVHTPNVPASEP